MAPTNHASSLSSPVDHHSVTAALDRYMSAPANQSEPKLYFGYGSNLWIQQMHSRCPDSHFVGIARLNNWAWIINSRGYANVVEKPKNFSMNAQHEVWGLVYYLNPDDEVQLDRNEGVPRAYTKEILSVDFWPSRLGELQLKIDVDEQPVKKEVLVYVDRKRTDTDDPKPEYVFRMNQGIKDALAFGVPEEYVNGVMRKFVTEQQTPDRKTVLKANKQALNFNDDEESE